MRGLKGGMLLLVLTIPMMLYVAWQINGVVRTDLIASEVPPDRGGTKDQLTASRAKAGTWAGEVRKAAGVAWQYGVPGPEDRVTDEAAAGLNNASGARSADLKDLDVFLSDIDSPTFNGKLRESYKKWTVEMKQAREDARAVTEWLANPPPVTSATEAVRAMNAVGGLINQYTARSKFADKGKALVWRVKARLLVLDALGKQADAEYRAAVRVKLPLEPGTNAVKTALETLRAVRLQIDGLNADLRQADEDKIPIEGTLRGAAESQGALADQCAAGEELLKLFAKEDLFTNPSGAAPWLAEVAAQHKRTKDEKVAALIREKVQEFCEAFIPANVRLDEKVVIRDERVDRGAVKIKYPEDGVIKRLALTSDPDGLNEFTAKDRYNPDTTLIAYGGSEEFLKDLKPTLLSQAGADYVRERRRVTDGANGPKWTAKTVDELKKACEKQKDWLDKLKMPEPKTKPKSPDKSDAEEPLKLWVRLSGLAEGIKRAPELFPER